tara:strand:+ start:273 stop:1439 length:1167 start_codon:yes stop_codon:yes gene_type:complete
MQELNPKIAHLSKEEIEELIKRYYSGEKIKDLIESFQISCHSSQLIKLFPKKQLSENCEYCGTALVKDWTSRGYSWGTNDAYCPSCKHSLNEHCRCKNCQDKRKRLREEKEKEEREFLTHFLNSQKSKSVDFSTLSLKEKIYLGAFLREGISEDFKIICPIGRFENSLAPTSDLSFEIIDSLKTKGIISISPISSYSSFEKINPETGNFTYYFNQVYWELNLHEDGKEQIDLINTLINPDFNLSSEEAYDFWIEIALNEALEYLEYNVGNALGIEFSAGKKTMLVLRDLLNNFSVSQIFAILYNSTNKAARFYLERNVSRNHAANSIITNAHNYAERALNENWNINKYRRLHELPESALSKFFFERIYPIGYNGFNTKPTRDRVITNV